jgi:hypothetical protein
MTKLAKLYDRLEALKEKEAALIEQINVERAAAVRKVEVTRIGTTGQYYYLTSGKRTVKVQKNRHYGWEVFEGRKKIWNDIRCSLYDLKVSMANGGI